MHTNTLIIGGGLAGLALADILHRGGHDFLLIEARDRLGGRILSGSATGAEFDLGPAWFWPGQPRMETLVARFGLTRFEQFAKGDLIFEDQNGVQRGRGYDSMAGSYRLKDGLGTLVRSLEQALPANKIALDAPIARISHRAELITAETPKRVVSANRVVLSLPPRLAARIAFEPALPQDTLSAMQGVATWMAGQAKAVAVYDRPFWRDEGLSGDAMSRRGPMVEIHDASPQSGGPFALFGFIGIAPEARRDETQLRQQIIAQFARLFGPKAENPRELFAKDWAFDPWTSAQADLIPLAAHPQYGLPKAMSQLWQGRLLFGGTEVAPQFGGYLEGALEAAEIAFETLINSH